MSSEIPLIDFGLFVDGTNEDREKIAKQLGDACRNVGFCYLFNHGICSTLIENVYQYAERFFSQSIDEKMKFYIGSSPYANNRGYTPIYEEKLSPKGDLKEGFDFALELPADDSDRIERGASLYGPNVWPDNLPGFRQCIYDEFYLKMISFGEQIFRAFALALDLPFDYFQSIYTNKPMVTMRLLFYPDQSIINEKDHLGCGEHTDYECFTLLSQSDHSALQILNKRGQWIDAVPIPHTFVLNIGDLMQRWTNDQFKSTIHRVINKTGEKRYSIPIFFGPNYFTEIRSLTNDQSNKYSPIIAGQYLTQRFNETYRYRENDSSLN